MLKNIPKLLSRQEMLSVLQEEEYYSREDWLKLIKFVNMHRNI